MVAGTMKRRTLVSVLLLSVLVVLPTLAYASPTDPTWIPGFYDDNDYDDVILFIIGAVTAVDSQAADPIGSIGSCVGLIAPPRSRVAAARPFESLSTRAPPPLFS